MKKLLHIIATPREEESRALQVTETFLKAFNEGHQDWAVEELDLTKERLPSLTRKRVEDAWQEIIAHIERFLSADAYLISTPMWNFSIPYTLKQYIDIIVRPKHLFRYTETGVEGLVKNKKMVVIVSRGGEYLTPETQKFDLQEPCLRVIFGYVGITDITFITAQPIRWTWALKRRYERVEKNMV